MSLNLSIAPGLKLDADYVAGGTFAYLAKKGAGKSYLARVMAEEFDRTKIPFVFLDPMGVAYGLRSGADGTSPGIPVAIFGGEHGDVPLEPGGGRIVADLVVDTGLSMILDLSGFGSRRQERQFAHDFLERLYRRNKDLVHLLIDEADLFAPQNPQQGDKPLLGVTENIVRRGRNRGIGVTLMTQRPAVLNKDVLTQIDGLVAMQVTGLTDRKAIDEWVKGHADDDAAAKVKPTLASLGKGECWWWVPEKGILELVQVRKTWTWDSSPTKTSGTRRRPPKAFADVDLQTVQERMAATIERAKAEDPKLLRIEIAERDRTIVELRRDLERQPTETLVPTLPPGLKPALEQLLGAVGHVSEAARGIAAVLGEHATATGEVAQFHRRRVAALEDEIASSAAAPAPPPRRAAPTARASAPPAPVPSPARAGGGDPDPSIGGAARKVLTVLAQYPEGRTKRQVAMLTGYSGKGGGFNNALSTLRTNEYINRGEPMLITDAGLAALGNGWEPLPTGRALLDHWLQQLEKAARLVLEALIDAPGHVLTKEQAASLTGYSPNGGGFNNALSRLRTLELIERGPDLRLDPTLMENT